jgi:prepilin-type N-terminal cleavage/methylation domain-containing protein
VIRALVNVRAEEGYSLVELIVVMAILGVVLSGLTAVFVGGSNAEAQLNSRFRAQQEARAATDRIRGDIHCASKAQALPDGTFLGLDVTSCNGTNGTTTTYAYWCTVSSSSSPQRYQLYRTSSTVPHTAATCTSTDTSRVLVASNLFRSAAFTTNPTPENGLQTVGVDFKVSGSRTTNSKEVYELTDSIVARNGPRCKTSSSNWDTSASTCTLVTVP